MIKDAWKKWKEEKQPAYGGFQLRGTVSFPKVFEEIPEVAEEIPKKPFPWGWVIATGSLIFSLIICLSTRKD